MCLKDYLLLNRTIVQKHKVKNLKKNKEKIVDVVEK